jgi:hypothetical protein
VVSGVYVGDDVLGKLGHAGVSHWPPPWSWPRGSTWDDVGGVFNPGTRAMLAGNKPGGSISVALHEFGHAVDCALGNPSLRSEFAEAHRRALNLADPAGTNPRWDPFGYPGGAGGDEMFAEGFAVVVSGAQEMLGSAAAPRVVNEYFGKLIGGL